MHKFVTSCAENHMRSKFLLQALAVVAPIDFLASLHKPLTSLLESLQSHDIERGEKSALAEILGGILASGAPWVVSNGERAWDVWVKQFTVSTLASVSLDMADTFATGIRYSKLQESFIFFSQMNCLPNPRLLVRSLECSRIHIIEASLLQSCICCMKS